MRKINEHFTDLNLTKVLLVPIKGELESIPSTAGPFDFSMRLGDETIFIGIRCYRSTESVAEGIRVIGQLRLKLYSMMRSRWSMNNFLRDGRLRSMSDLVYNGCLGSRLRLDFL